MDTLGADFYFAVNAMREQLGANAVPLQLPIGKEDSFVGVVDLVNMNAVIYKDDEGKDMEITQIPADMVDLAKEYRAKLNEAVAETDDADKLVAVVAAFKARVLALMSPFIIGAYNE